MPLRLRLHSHLCVPWSKGVDCWLPVTESCSNLCVNELLGRQMPTVDLNSRPFLLLGSYLALFQNTNRNLDLSIAHTKGYCGLTILCSVSNLCETARLAERQLPCRSLEAHIPQPGGYTWVSVILYDSYHDLERLENNFRHSVFFWHFMPFCEPLPTHLANILNHSAHCVHK